MPPSAARPNRSTQGSRWELDQRGRESVQAVQKSRARPHFARFAVLAAAPYCLLTVSPTQTADCEEMTKKLFLGRKLSIRSEEHTSELQSHVNLVCRLLLEK